jgi:hypothetical protein
MENKGIGKMRAIALAILLGCGSIEYAIKGTSPSQGVNNMMQFFAAVFFVCLIFGW